MEIDLDRRAVIAAAKASGVHEEILELELGYETPVGPSGVPLSAGQAQQLSLARALYCDPTLLVLDEPNAAFDADGSASLHTAIVDSKNRGSAVIVMTHRPTAISACDRLLVLENGRVVGIGALDEIVHSMVKNSGAVHLLIGENCVR